MSWDIIVQDLPFDAKTPADIPDDYEPKPIGIRDDIISKIKSVVPSANFADRSWGIIDNADFSIEISLDEDDPVVFISMHVRGGDQAMCVVAAIIDGLGVRGIDCQTSEFFDSGPKALQSFAAWRIYRDRAVGKNEE